MSLFYWKPEYSVGIKKIDSQHQSLILLINELHDSIESNFSEQSFENILKKLFDYTRYHFTTEEEMMEASNYPKGQLTKHKKQHQLFIAELNGCQTDIENVSLEDAVIIQEFLVNWLKNHILKIDTQLAKYLLDETQNNHLLSKTTQPESPSHQDNHEAIKLIQEIQTLAKAAMNQDLNKENASKLSKLADELLEITKQSINH